MAQVKVKCGSCGAPASNETDNCNFCGSTIVHALGGMGLLRAGKPALDKAFTEFKAQLKKNPDDPDAHFGLASYYVKRGLHKEAQEYLKKAADLAPNAGEIPYLRAMNLGLWRGWGNALIKPHAQNALKLKPDLREAKSLLLIYEGATRSRHAKTSNDLSSALESLRKAKAFKVKEHLPHIYALCGETFELAQRPEDALNMYKTAVSLGKKTARVYTRMGLINKKAGRPKRALGCFEKAHELEPSNPAVSREISQLKG